MFCASAGSVAMRSSAKPGIESFDARTSISTANAERSAPFSSEAQRALTSRMMFSAMRLNCASETGREGSASLLRRSEAKRSLMTVSATGGTVAKTSAIIFVRLPAPADVTAARLMLRNRAVFASTEPGIFSIASFTSRRNVSWSDADRDLIVEAISLGDWMHEPILARASERGILAAKDTVATHAATRAIFNLIAFIS